MSKGKPPPVQGTVAKGYEEVRTAFEEAFAEEGELGAACCVIRECEVLVDLWGGYTDKRRRKEWQQDTLVLCYSISKGMSAIASAHAVSRGLFDYDEKVTTYWPEFAQGGKSDVTVRQLLSEQAGLSCIRTRLNARKMMEPHKLAAVLAEQKPSWNPGDWSGNHACTIGWLHSELIRRTDPDGRGLGQYFREEIAEPLGVDFHFGLPESEDGRMARIQGWWIPRLFLHLKTMPWKMVFSMFMPWTLTFKTFANPFVMNPAALDKPAYWRGENGGAGGIGNARAIAKLYGEFACGGVKLGIRPDILNELRCDAVMPQSGWMDCVFKADLQYALGLEKPSHEFPFGSSQSAFGTFAIGGSMGFADPDAKVGYAYTTNKMGFHRWNDPREMRVRNAFYRALKKQKVMRGPRKFTAVQPRQVKHQHYLVDDRA